MPHHSARALVSAILGAWLLGAPSVSAEFSVIGESEDIQIEVENASVKDVMEALGANFGLRYRSMVPLSRRLTGTHRGPLQRVIGRLLDGYDCVVKTDSDGIEVTVHGAVRPEGAAEGPAGPGGAAPDEASQQSKSVKSAPPSNGLKTSTARSRRDARRKPIVD